MTESVGRTEADEVPLGGDTNGPSRAGFFALAVGSIGAVYGDIGTSPLYAFREAIAAASGSQNYELLKHGKQGLARGDVLGVVSLILWALTIIVTLKYVLVLLRADNTGEGGTLTLMALASRAFNRVGRSVGVIALLGIVSAALFYGDATITPALSVLSAIEGIDVATPAFHDYVVPLTVVILLALFALQSRGAAKVAAMFGPIMCVWFVVIAVAGAFRLASDPGVLRSLDPFYGAAFLVHHGMISLYTLGA